jgi:hypothetical protein
MKLFKTAELAQIATNKLLKAIGFDLPYLDRVYVEDMMEVGYEKNVYYASMIFVLDLESFDNQMADIVRSYKFDLIKNVDTFLGIKLIVNQTGVTTKK